MMLKTRLILWLSAIIPSIVIAQEASVKVTLLNTNTKTIEFLQPRDISNPDPLKNISYKLALNTEGSAAQTFAIKKPQFVILACFDTEKRKNLTYSFFLSPGDQLHFTADFAAADFNIKVNGKGSNNNQPLLANVPNFKTQAFNKDTVPTRFIQALNQQQRHLESTLAKYIAAYQPDATFIENWKAKLKYYSSNVYFNFKTANQFFIRSAYDRNLAAWQKVQDSLFLFKDLNNDEALAVSDYTALIRMILLREKERLWIAQDKNPERFFREWYQTDTLTGRKLYQADNENVLKEKIINKNFKGKTAEYLYTIVLQEAIKMSLIKNADLVFERFKQQYPHSRYLAVLQPQIDEIVKKQRQKLKPTMVFAKDNGKNINTFEELLLLNKGKTVLLDMWGTWCGPCREEIANNGKEIKAYFNDRGLDYLYIANDDLKNEQKWKALIAYFNMDGTHILANKKLTEDITQKIKSNVFPTYVILKKDGTFEVCKIGFPMDRSLLFKQVDAALALKD